MAGNRIDMDLSVQDRGNTIKDRTNDAKKLNEQLERSQNLMRGTKTGSQAMRRAGFDPESADVGNYNRARGVTGGGGAAGRDFSDQARGLGGLVRLYATWAANIFAVSAAFNALRDAMSTDIMIKGLDQLGAATGTAMGGVAKDFARASDGAISFRESMEATAKALSSGMSTEQFMQLGKVAKGASQALGLNMSDAVSRLTRGITKLEPELLDELGIFTKVGRATEDYARQLGKAESQLTDFERRQAFANAVLKEGTDKFGEIAQSANPYDQLLASLKDTAQNILSVVNSIVGPIAKLLADNTALIGAGIALAAAKITSQALPELLKWRQAIKASADDAKKKSEDISFAFEEAFALRKVQAAGIPGLRENVEKAKKELKEAQQQLTGVTTDKRTAQSSWFKQATTEDVLNEKTVTRLTEQQQKFEQGKTVSMKEQAAARERLLRANENVLAAEKKLEDVSKGLDDSMESRARWGSELWQREELALKAKRKSTELDIQSRVVQNVDKLGLAGGIGELINETKANKELTTFGRIKTIGVGSLTAIARAAEIAFNAFSKLFNYVAIAYTIFEIGEVLFSGNSKAVKELTDQLDRLSEANKNAEETAKRFQNSLSVDAIIAYTNSFNNLSDQLTKTVEGLKTAQAESTVWDQFFDKIKDWTPGLDSLNEKAGTEVAKSIVSAIKLAPAGPARKALEDKYRSILGIDTKLPLNVKNISNALDDLSDAEFDTNIGLINEATKDANKTFGQSNKILSALKDQAEATTKSFQNLANSVSDKSPLTEFLTNSLKLNNQLLAALNSDNDLTRMGVASFIDKIDSLKGFSPELIQSFGEVTIEFEKINKQAEEFRKEIYAAQTALDQLPAAGTLTLKERALGKGSGFGPNRKEFKGEVDQARETQQQIIDNATSELDKLTPKLVEKQNQLRDIIEKNTQRAIEGLIKKSSLELGKLKLEASKVILELVPEAKTVETVQARMNIEKQQIQIETALLNQQTDLILEQHMNTLALESLRAEMTLARLAEERKSGSPNVRRLENIMEEEKGAQKVLDVNKSIQDALKGGTKSIGELMKRPESAEYRDKLAQIFNITSQKDKNQQEAFNKILRSEFQGRIEQIGIIYTEKAKVLQDAYDRVNNAAQVLATGPEADIFKQQMELILARLKDQEKILEFDKTLAALEIKLQGAKKLGDQRLVETVQTEIKTAGEKKTRAQQLIDEQEATRKANAEANQRILLKTREVELETKLAEVTKEQLIGTSALAEEQRILADRRVRTLQLQLEEFKRIEEQRALDKQTINDRKRIAELEAKQGYNETGLNAADKAELEGLKEKVKFADRLSSVYTRLRQLGMDKEAATQVKENIQIAVANIAEVQKFLDAAFIKNQAILETETQRTESSINFEDQRIERLRNRMSLTDEDYRNQKIRLGDLGIEVKLKRDLAAADKAIEDAERSLLRTRLEEGIMEDGEDTYNAAIEQGKAAVEAARQSRNRIVLASEDAKLQVRNNLQDLTREAAYATAFENTMKRMEDAIVNFAQTGKINFKDMINSFLSDLLRYEVQQTMRKSISAAGGSEGIIGSLFAGAKSLFGFANGGYANLGMPIKKYAMGGIIDRPTLFTYANGTNKADMALVGEGKYSEAVVPLPDGKTIPVTMNGSKGGEVYVTVNNNTNQQAKVSESKDSRGNRRIEVTVGDMVAGEISRTGSTLQQTFSNTYGIGQMVGRR